MKYNHCPVPTSIVRSSTSRIATFETHIFLAHNVAWRDGVRSTALNSRRGKTLLVTFVTAALVIAAFLLGIAAAQADPANTANHATILRFTNKVEFGAVQSVKAKANVDSTIAQFFAKREHHEQESIDFPRVSAPEHRHRFVENALGIRKMPHG